MVQPYDYRLNLPSPIEAFTQGMQIGAASRQIRQQRAAEERQVQMQQDMQELFRSPSPQQFANFYLKYPEAMERVEAYRKTLSDADKNTTTEFATQAFALNSANKPEQVLALFDRYIAGATNSNRSDMARVLSDAKQVFQQIDEPKAREALIASVLAGTGKEGLDLYKTLYASNLDLDTSLIKNVVALGFKPGTPEFQSELRKQMDKVTIIRPDGTFIQGAPDEIRSILPGGGKVLPRVTTKEEADRLPPGAEFIGPDGKAYRKPGGQTGSTPSGGFPER